MADKSPTILFVALSGIGNLIMQLPTIEATRRLYPTSHIAVWVAPRGTAALAKHNPSINEVIEAPIKGNLSHHIHTIGRLRDVHADIAIVLSPGQLIKSALYLTLTGIPKRIGHTYPLNGNPSSHFLLTDYIIEDENLHDIEQNLSLLKILSPTYQLPASSADRQTANYSLAIPSEYQEKGNQVLEVLHLDPTKPIIGLHAGSAPDFSWKRWPLENFAHLAQALIDKHNVQVLLFGGPDETEQNQALQQTINRPVTHIVKADLLTTEAIMKQCRIIISNDSGLMHVSSAIGTKTFGLFGPTDEKKTGPRGSDSHIIRAPGTSPVYHTEKNYSLGSEPHASMLAITPELVLQQVVSSLPAR